MDTGLLGDVGSVEITSLQSLTISLTWTPPFTLDIVDEPDIIGYCVLVNEDSYVDVEVSTSSLPSNCTISQPEYNFTLPSGSTCRVYKFAVYAFNVVGNGMQSNASYNQDQTSRSRK